MRNSRLDEAQVGIKIARRNINNLRYADDAKIQTRLNDWTELNWKSHFEKPDGFGKTVKEQKKFKK